MTASKTAGWERAVSAWQSPKVYDVMNEGLDVYLERVRLSLETLSRNRTAFLCALLAINAITAPYLGYYHDARLYAAQTAERVDPGSFASDLYLLHGSQDSYSVFSTVMAPIAACLGLRASFFLLYVVSKAFFFWAAIRFVSAVVRDGLVIAWALLFLAIAPVGFGGNGVFHVNESFLTPRIAASGLVLWGLERLFAGRMLAALVVQMLALAVHPLQGSGGLVIVGLTCAGRQLSARQRLFALGLVVCSGMVLLCEPVGGRLLGVLDEEWRSVILEVCCFIRPSEWGLQDWARIVVSTLIVGASAIWVVRNLSWYLGVVLFVSLGALLATAIGVRSNYLLLVQGSPYRALWLLEVHSIVLGLAIAVRLWQENSSLGRPLGAALFVLVTAEWMNDACWPVLLYGAMFVSFTVGFRGLERVPRTADWKERATAWSVVASIGLLGLYDVATLAKLFSVAPSFEVDVHPVLVLHLVSKVLFKLPVLVAIACALPHFLVLVGRGWRRVGVLAIVWVGYQGALLTIGDTDWYGRKFGAAYPHRRFVESYLDDRAREVGRAPTVYWPVELRCMWFDCGSHSYFNWAQLSGCAFSRGTAMEGKRRAMLVQNFELECVHRSASVDPAWELACRFYHFDGMVRGAGVEDLRKLCEDGILDYVILEHEFDRLACATDGRYWIYDCKQLRQTGAFRNGSQNGSPGIDSTARSVLAAVPVPSTLRDH
jgi:hypothetical protein